MDIKRNELFNILKVLGLGENRIVSIVNHANGNTYKYILYFNGLIGKKPSDKSDLLFQIQDAMTNGGSMLITVYTGDIRTLYGIALGDNNWRSISQEEVFDFFYTDHLTGKQLPVNPYVFISDLDQLSIDDQQLV